MARLARVVVPGHPHHVTQRGNGGARVFFSDADYALYRDLLGECCRAADVEIWGPDYGDRITVTVHLIRRKAVAGTN